DVRRGRRADRRRPSPRGARPTCPHYGGRRPPGEPMSRTSPRPLLPVSLAVLGVLCVFALVGAPVSAALYGRDSSLFMWTAAARVTLAAGTAVMVVAFAAGIAAGTPAALGPPVADALLARLVEVSGALPSFAIVVILRALRPTAELGTIAAVLAVLRGLSLA